MARASYSLSASSQRPSLGLFAMRFIMVAAPISLWPVAALAGAWTQPAGSAFMSVVDGPDPDGPTGLRRDRYLEMGVTDTFTVGLNLNQRIELHEDSYAGRAEGFLRQRLWRGRDGDVLSAQYELGGGVAAPEDDVDHTIRMMYGRGFSTSLGQAWAEAALGWRFETGIAADRALGGLTLGLRPVPEWLAAAQAEADLDGDRSDDAWEAMRLSTTIARDIGGGDMASMKIETTPWATGVTEAFHIRFGLWREF